MSQTIETQGLTATLTELVLPIGLTVDRFDIELGPTRVETSPLRILPAAAAFVDAEVSAASVAAFLNKKAPGGLSKFKVSCKDGLVTVDAKAKMLVEIPVSAIVTLEIVDGHKVMARLKSAEVMGGGASGLVDGMMDKINPILNTHDFPLPITLTEIEADNNMVTLHGEVMPPEDMS